MTGSKSQATQLIDAVVTAEDLRACMAPLGWRVDFAGDHCLVAVLKTKGIGHQEFFSQVSWKTETAASVLITITVQKKNQNKQAKIACENQIQILLKAISESVL